LPVEGLSFAAESQLGELAVCFERLSDAVSGGEACPPTLEADIWHLIAQVSASIWAKAGAWEDANMEEVLRYRVATNGTA
jgi:hypothetical protein